MGYKDYGVGKITIHPYTYFAFIQVSLKIHIRSFFSKGSFTKKNFNKINSREIGEKGQ